MILNRQARATRGFTLTEAAIVLGIVGLILGAIWVAAAAVYNNMRVNTSKRQILTIAQNIRTLNATRSTMAASTAATLVRAGIFPGDMVIGTVARDIWEGNVVVSQETGTSGTPGEAFGIHFQRIPQSACVDLLVTMTGQGRDAGLIGAGGGPGVAAPAITVNNSFAEIDPDTAAGQCTNTAGNNSVKFIFKLKG